MTIRASAAIIALALTSRAALSQRATPAPRQPGVTTAVFTLDNKQSGVLKIGGSRIVAVSGFVGRVAHERPYGTEALEIEFFTVPLTDADRADLTENDGRKARKGDHVIFVICLDTARKATQVNMTYVVPGTTVVRSVAYTALKLKSDFSDLQFDGKRLRFKSKAKFEELDDKKAPLTLAWDVDVDLPAVDRPGH